MFVTLNLMGRLLSISVVMMISISASAQIPELWTGPNLPHNVRDLPAISSATYVDVHQAVVGGDQFLLGASIVEHNGTLYANWANGPFDENSNAEHVCGKKSADGGLTWSDLEGVAPSLPGTFARSHGPYLKHDGKLWFFGMRFEYADDASRVVNTEAFLLNEVTGEWESYGLVALGGGMVDAPVRMANGNWIVGAVYTGFWACAFISHGDDFTKWDRVPIPVAAGDKCSETTIIVHDSKLIAIMRSSFPGVAGISISENYGRSWATAQASDFPMVQTKPFGGVLSNGQQYIIANVSDGRCDDHNEDRDTLVVAVGSAGSQSFSRMWKIRQGKTEQPIFEGAAKMKGWQYPYAYEYNGNLYVIYALGKEDCELAIIPLSALSTSGSAGWVVPTTGQLFSAVTWSGGTGTDWTHGGNWDGGIVPASDFTTDIAEFIDSAAVSCMPTINASRNIHGVDFDSGGWTIGSNGSSTWGIGAAGITFDTDGVAGVNTILPKVFLASNQCWTVSQGNTLVVTNAAIVGARTLVKAGEGVLVFAGKTNSMSGVVVSNGTVLVDSSSHFIAPVSVADGAILGGQGVISAAVAIADGGMVSPGSVAVGTLTTASLALSNDSVLEVRLDALAGSSDQLVTGNLVLDGLLDVTNLGGMEEGVYPLITYSGTLTNNGLQINSFPAGFTGVISASGGIVRLIVSGPVVWDGSNSSDWTHGGNWDAGVMPVSDYATETARFGDASVPNMPIINASRNICGVVFERAGWTIGSNGSSILGVGYAGVMLDAAWPGGGVIIQSKIHLGVDQSWDVNAAGALEVTGDVSGASVALTKTGAGQLILSGTNNSYGNTIVSSGTLLVDGWLDARAATVTVNSAATLGGVGVINRSVVVANGGVVAPGHNGVGMLSASNLTLGSTSILDFEFSTAGSGDQISTGDLVLDGQLSITDLGGVSVGSYELITYSGALVDNGVELTDIPDGFVGNVSVSAGAVNLTVLAAPSSVVVWDGSNNSDWTYGENWDTGIMPENNYTSAVARFEASGATFNMPVINASRNINGVDFSGTGWTIGSNGSSGWGIGAGGISISAVGVGGANIIESRVNLGVDQSWSVSAGNQLYVSNNVGGATAALTKTGPGKLVLSGSNNSYGNTIVSGGTLVVNGMLDARVATVVVQDAAILGGAGTIRRSVEIANRGTLAPGNNSVGALSVSNLILNGASVLDFELGAVGGGDRIDAGGLVLDGQLRVTSMGSLSAGSYTIITYAGTLIDNGLEISPGALPYGFKGRLSVSNGVVRLILMNVTAWDGSNSVDWTNGANWESGIMPGSDYATGIACFVNSADVPYMPTINASRNISGIRFLCTGWEVGSNGSSIWGIGGDGVTVNDADAAGSNIIQSKVNLGASQSWFVSTGSQLSVNGDISGAASALTKEGPGELILSGSNNSFGGLIVSDGTLLVNGQLDARASSVTVSNAATLGGAGTISRSVTIADGGIVAPGSAGAGVLAVSNLILNSSSILNFELSSLNGCDRINAGNLTLDGQLRVVNLGGLVAGDYTLLTYVGTLTDSGLQIGSLPSEFSGSIAVSGGTVRLTLVDQASRAEAEELPYGSILSMDVVSSGTIKIVIHMPDTAGRYSPKSTTNLVGGSWAGVPHSNGSEGPFIVTNLNYSAVEGSNRVIYVRDDDAGMFFRIAGE